MHHMPKKSKSALEGEKITSKNKKWVRLDSSQEKKFVNWHSRMKVYFVLLAIRFALVLLPQNGYVHPDEFFQSVEVIAGDVFDLDVFRPWEFNVTFPIRSIIIPSITVGLPFRILKCISNVTSYLFNVSLLTPYMMLVIPRLAVTCLSLICDYCLWHMCCLYGQNSTARLTVFASSYIVLIHGTRTFSNTVEMILLAVLLTLVVDTMKHTHEVVWRDDMIVDRYSTAGRERPVERARLIRLRRSLEKNSLQNCIAIAIVTVIGIFNRPTFVAYAFPALFFWLQRGLGSHAINFTDFHIRIFTLSAFGLLTATICIIIDSGYYGYLTVAEIFSLEVKLDHHFIITPFNFLLYNYNSSNLSEHGLHPRWLHAFVNLPLNFNVLGILGLVVIINNIRLFMHGKWLHLPKAQSVTTLMNATFVLPLVMLSLFRHQEPRFIIPVLIPLVFLYSQKILQHKYLASLWYMFNIFGLLFFGFLQQGGVWGLINHFYNSGLTNPPPLNSVHIISTHVYMLPKFPLLLPNPSQTLLGSGNRKYRIARRFHIHEVGSSDTYGLVTAQDILNQCDMDWEDRRLMCKVFSVYPGTRQKEFENALQFYNFTQNVNNIIRFYPHINTDALPNIFEDSSQKLYINIPKKFTELCLVLSEIRLKKYFGP